MLDRSTIDDVVVVRVTGLVDERFAGFGDVGHAKSVVIDVSGMTRMTSFGVRQWMKALDALPKSITDRYLLGCPLFFIDQLNMVLNFGGGAQILTAVAPYVCAACGSESLEMIDLLAERAVIARRAAPERSCQSCGAKLELDESPESYFGFATKYAATKLRPEVARHLARSGLYTSAEAGPDTPPKVIKIVQNEVTYFRISGTIGATFRSRPFVVGAEGEIVLDLAAVTRFDTTGQAEWRRLVKGMSNQVTSITLVDISPGFLAMAPDSFSAPKVTVASLLVPYECTECGRRWQHSHALTSQSALGTLVCTTCGGTAEHDMSSKLVAALHAAARTPPAASAKLIARRDDMLSRALTDAKVAQAAGQTATEETILGNYKIVRKLSAGGMAEVFLANQVGIGGFEKPVAVKRIQRKFLESRQMAIDMFLNEAKIAGRLTHPNIVQVLDVGEVGGALYLAMEYVRGKDLRDVIKMLQANGEMIPLSIACYIVHEVAQALHHAYWSTDIEGGRLSVVHRDVSPHNIILSFDGAVKLLDFGVAMSSVTEQDETMIVGKWMYMSPEHTTKQIDHRSDLFSLGVCLYLLCSGRMPFSGASPLEIVDKVAEGEYARLTGVPAPLVHLVDSMLAAKPDQRPQTGQAVASALDDIMRRHKLTCTAADVAAFLNQLFIYESAAVEATSTTTAVDDMTMMDITTVKLAAGSGPTQAQAAGTPSAGMPTAPPPPDTSPPATSPSGVLSAASDSNVSFTPAVPMPPQPVPTSRASQIWIAAAIAIVVLIVILAIALR